MPGLRTNFKRVTLLYGNKCIYCGDPAQTVDHVIPLALGGSNNIGNRRPSCDWCNQLKASMTIVEFVQKYPDLIRPDFEYPDTTDIVDNEGGFKHSVSVTKNCLHCGKPFTKMLAPHQIEEAKYCTTRHANAARNRGRKGKSKMTYSIGSVLTGLDFTPGV